jgi:hypothetical protein
VLTATEQLWFLKCDYCGTFAKWIEKHQETVKPFRFDFTPFYVVDERSYSVISIIQYDAQRLAHLLREVALSSLESLDVNDFNAIENAVVELRSMYALCEGSLIGQEARVWRASQPYKAGPGKKSAERGKYTISLVRMILEKICGGIKGYKELPRGKKTLVKEVLAKETLLDTRQVENVLKKLKEEINKK